MTYTAKTAQQLRRETGSLVSKIASELGLIETEMAAIETGEALQQSKFADLTASMVSSTSLAANGADLASGTNATYYAVFVAPVDLTLIKMYDYITEAYVKDTTDAKITLQNAAGTKLFERTLTAAGEAAAAFHSTTVESGAASMTAGQRIDMVITASASSSGTGHAKVQIEYIER